MFSKSFTILLAALSVTSVVVGSPCAINQGQRPNKDGINDNNSSNDDGVPGIPSFASGNKTGEGTYYDTGLTSCGRTYSNNDFIAAVSKDLYDAWSNAGANPNLNPICEKRVKAIFEGKSVEVTVVDRCVGCAMWDLDFTPRAFQQIADMSRGRIQGVTWSFI